MQFFVGGATVHIEADFRNSERMLLHNAVLNYKAKLCRFLSLGICYRICSYLAMNDVNGSKIKAGNN